MADFDPLSVGAVAVAEPPAVGGSSPAAVSDFDPTSVGAVPVDDEFDPTSVGAVPVPDEPKKSGIWSSFKESLSSSLADVSAGVVDLFTPMGQKETEKMYAKAGQVPPPSLISEEETAKNESLIKSMRQEASVLRQAAPLAFEESDPTSKNLGAQVGRGAASVASMIPAMATGPAALPLMALQGAGQAYEAKYRETEEVLKSEGVTDEDVIRDTATQAGDKAAIKTAPHLLLYMAGGKAASGLAGKLLGTEASAISRGLVGAGTASVANVATSSVLRALEAKPGERLQAAIPTIESLTADTLFSVYHGVNTYRDASLQAKRSAYQELQKRGFSKEDLKTAPTEQKSEAVIEKTPEEIVVETAAPPTIAPEPVAATSPKVAPLSPHPPTQSGEHIVSTGIMTPEGIATGEAWNTKHADIIKNSETIKSALAEGMGPDQLDANKGFIIQDAEGNQKFVGRKRAVEVGRKSGQVDESILYTPGELISEALIQPKGAPSAAGPEPVSVTDPTTAEFKQWFKNSNVVDSEGKPLVVYHGTPEVGIGVFKPGKGKRGFGGWNNIGTWFTADKVQAEQYGEHFNKEGNLQKGTVYPAYLSFKNPWELQGRAGWDEMIRVANHRVGKRTNDWTAEDVEKFREYLRASGKDGIIIRGLEGDSMKGANPKQDYYLALYPEQIRVKQTKGAPSAKETGAKTEERSSEQELESGEKERLRVRDDEKPGVEAKEGEVGAGVSMGPGAASVKETLATYEQRKFAERFQETPEIAEEVKRATGDRYYEPIPNKVSAEQAVKLIEERGEDVITEQIKDTSTDLSYTDRSVVAQILMKRWNERYKSLKESNPEEASKTLDRTADLAEWFAAEGTRLGEGVQSYSMWNRMTPAGKLKSFKRAVNKIRSRHKADNRTEVEEIKDILNGEQTSPEKIRSLETISRTNKTARRIKKDIKKVVDASKGGKITDEKFYDLLSDRLGLPKFDPDAAKEIIRLAMKVEEAPEGMPKQEATKELHTYIARQKGFDWIELPFGMYYGNMLSGLNTQAVNLVDTALNVQYEITNLMINEPKAASAIMSGALKGVSEGRWDAMLTLTEGRRISNGKLVEDPFFMEISKFGEKGGVPIRTGTRTGRVIKAIAELQTLPKFVGTKSPLNWYKYVGRAMSASDTIAFRTAQEAKAAQLSWRLAHEEGAVGDALRARMDEILGYDRLPDFRKQAELEGFTGYKAEARAFELMELSRPEELQKASRDFASESTYNVKPYGVLGAVSNKIEEFSRDYKALKLVVPFTRIVANVTNRGLNNTPYGYVRAWRGKAGKGQAEKIFSPEEKLALNIRATMGTVALASLLVLHEMGVIDISGQGPSNPEEKKQKRETGWRPYSIKVGDTHYTYTYTPIGLGLSIMGNMLDAIKYKGFSQKDALGVAAYAFSSIGSTLFNQSFMSSLSSLFESLSGTSPAIQINALKRWASRLVPAVGVPFSGLLRDVESMFDPSIAKADTFTQSLISSIPFASHALKPQLNAFGEPIKSLRNRFWKGENPDPVWKFVADKQLRVPVASQFFDDPDQNYEYTKRTGQKMRGWMEESIPMLKGLERKAAQDVMENQADYFRAVVRAELMGEGAKKKPKKD